MKPRFFVPLFTLVALLAASPIAAIAGTTASWMVVTAVVPPRSEISLQDSGALSIHGNAATEIAFEKLGDGPELGAAALSEPRLPVFVRAVVGSYESDVAVITDDAPIDVRALLPPNASGVVTVTETF